MGERNLTGIDPSINIDIYSDELKNTTVRYVLCLVRNSILTIVKQSYKVPGPPVWGE